MTSSPSRAAGAFDAVSETDIESVFERANYVATDEIVTTVYLALRLGKPLLVEGEPGSGKTELGKVLAEGFETELIRLQCYEGLTAEHTLYEWNYTKQLLDVQAGTAGGQPTGDGDADAASVFSEEYLLERPLYRAVTYDGETPPVLLIDEIDRADEEFEALLLEFLSDFQITIPEFGTIEADRRPIVIVTSNRTRALSDALKRRCLYLHVSLPDEAREREIVERKVPQLSGDSIAALCRVVQRLRDEPMRKPPGIAETLDWTRAIAELRRGGEGHLTERELETTLGCLLKESADVERVDGDLLAELLAAAGGGADPGESDRADDASDR